MTRSTKFKTMMEALETLSGQVKALSAGEETRFGPDFRHQLLRCVNNLLDAYNGEIVRKNDISPS